MRSRLLALGALGAGLSLFACFSGGDDGVSGNEQADTELPPKPAGQPLSVCPFEYGTIDSILSFRTADVALSPDGKLLAYTTCDGAPDKNQQLVLQDVATGKRTAVAEDREVHRVRFSPDGKYLSYAARPRGDAGAGGLQVEIRSVDGAVVKPIPFFTKNRSSIAQQVEGFAVAFTPDGKTAVAYGYEVDGDERSGRIVISPLASPGEKAFSTPAGIDANADVTFAGDRVMLISTMQARAVGVGASRPPFVYEVTLGGLLPELAANPPWVRAGGSFASSFVPGSYDGDRVLRWDPLPAADGTGRLVAVARDGSTVKLSEDTGTVLPWSPYFRDVEMRGMNRGALYASKSPNAPVLFFGRPAGANDPNPARGTLYARPRDGSAPATVVSTNVLDLTTPTGIQAVAPNGRAVFRRDDGLGLYDPATATASAFYSAPAGVEPKVVAMSPDGAKVAVIEWTKLGSEAGPRELVVVDVATGARTKIVAPADRPVVPFGPWLPALAQGGCGFDTLDARLDADGSAFALASFFTRGACDRAYAPPELWRFSVDGTAHVTHPLPSLSVRLQRRGWEDPPVLRVAAGRAVVSACEVETPGCVVEVLPIPAPPGGAAPAAQDAGAGAPSAPKPTSAPGVTPPSNADAPSPAGDDGETPEGSAPAAPLPKPASTTSHACSAARDVGGARGGAGLALAAVAAATAAGRRRRVFGGRGRA